MTASNSSFGNVMSRLQGLKNVSGQPKRRVMPGAEFLQDLEDENPDISGTAFKLPNFANFAPTKPNEPESDLGGELTSQSYDVRANTVNNPQEDQPNFFSKLGQALANYVSPGKPAEMQLPNNALFNNFVADKPPVETAQTNSQEGLSPLEVPKNALFNNFVDIKPRVPPGNGNALRSTEPQPSSGVLGALSDWLNPTKRSEMLEYQKELSQDAQLRAQGKNPDEVRNQTNEQQNLTHDQKKALQEPWKYSAYGSAEQVANNPALQAEFKNITGIDYEPQIAAQITEHEAAMKGVEDALNGLHTQLDEQAEGIKQRILNNQSTDADKYYIGLALLMPLLIGGMFGKEAALGALGGGAKGIADVLGGRQKNIREDEAALLDIGKQQSINQEKLGNINLEKAKLGPSIRKNLPEDPNAHLLGMREKVWTDPNTGEQLQGVEIKPGFLARPEYVASKEGKTDMLKAANELTKTKTYVDEVNDLTEDVINIVDQLDDPNFAWKSFTEIMTGKKPTLLSKLTQDIMFNGRKVNAGVVLEEKLGFLANAYGMAKDIGQLDRAAQNHIKKIIDNPTSSFLTPQDSKNQVLEVRKLAQRGLVNSAANSGFYPEFVIADMEKSNNPLFQKLNQSDDEKYNEELKKKAFQGEINYAK